MREQENSKDFNCEPWLAQGVVMVDVVQIDLFSLSQEVWKMKLLKMVVLLKVWTVNPLRLQT